MKSKLKQVFPIIYIIGTLIPLWFFICNMQPLGPSSYAFSFIVLIGLFLVVKIFFYQQFSFVVNYIKKWSEHRHFAFITLSTAMIISLLIRLFFYIRFTYTPVSDPVTFYESAKTLAVSGKIVGNSYVAFQPYLSAYNNMLGFAMRLISDKWLATILLNTLFDFLAAFSLYILLKKALKLPNIFATLAFIVWVLNPLNIIFSVISLPVITVNFFIILSILIVHLLIRDTRELDTKKAILKSIILGLILGLGNCFRPIFYVPLIALFIICIHIYLNTNNSAKFIKLALICIAIPFSVFSGIQFINLKFVSKQTGLPVAKNPSGWSMYVGSTRESGGEWRPYHNEEMARICAYSLARKDFNECHNALRRIAIERYQNYGIFGTSKLFIQKLYHQSEEQNYFYNAENSIKGYSMSRLYKTLNLIMVVYMATLFLLSAMFLYGSSEYSKANKALNTTFLFSTLIMIGWFFSLMLVESAPRYSTIFYPIFTLFSILALFEKYNRAEN